MAPALPPIHTNRTTGVWFISRSSRTASIRFAAATGSASPATASPCANMFTVGFFSSKPSTGVKMARIRISSMTQVAVSRSLST